MKCEPLALAEVRLIRLEVNRDPRGEFVETYDRHVLAGFGIDEEFVLDGYSVSARRGTVRGLHFQAPPVAQARLVRVGRGRIFDVAVDLRRSSTTFGRHVAVVLDAAEPAVLYVPVGFAHGFCTLADDTQVLYKMSARYSPSHAMGLLWNDPDLAIAWPIGTEDAVLSASDRAAPRLKDLPSIYSVAR